MKNLKNLGTALSKAEQQSINGGKTTLSFPCYCNGEHRANVQSISECIDWCDTPEGDYPGDWD